MKRHLLVVGAVLGVLAQISAACAPAAPAPAAAPTSAPTSAPAAKPTTAPAAVASPAASPASAAASPAVSPAAVASPSAAVVSQPSATSAPAASGPTTHLVVSYSERIGSNIANWMAKEGGFFQQNGLDVELQLIPSANSIAALLSGQTQIASGGGAEALSAISGGADLVVVGNLAPVYPYEFLVPADVKTIADLKGKRVGVSSVGSSSDIATRVGLKAQGLNPDTDVQIVAVGSLENRTAAMLTGAIQGGVAQPPDTVTLQDKGMHVLFDMAAQKLPAVNTGLEIQRSWASANKAVVQKYVDSLIQATAKAKQDRAATIAVMKKYYQIDDDRAVGAAYDYFVGEVVPAYPYATPAQFADAVAQLSEKNPKIKDIDLTKVIDSSYIQDAENRKLAGS